MKLKHKSIYIVEGKERTKEEIPPELMNSIKKELMKRSIEAIGAVPITS